MADVSITIQLVDSNDDSTSGIVAIYGTDNTLVHRASVEDSAPFTLDDQTQYTVSVLGANHVFEPFTLTPVEGDIFVATGVSPTVPTPSRADLCIIYGDLLKVDGSPATGTFFITALIRSGRLDTDSDIFREDIIRIEPDDKGRVQFELLKNRYYRIALYLNGYYSEPREIYDTFVPDQTSLPFVSFIYPYAKTVSFVDAVLGEGDYVFSVTLSNGEVLTKHEDVAALVELESENVDAEITKTTSGLPNLRVRDPKAGGIIKLFGTRRGIERISDTLSQRGRVTGNRIRQITF